MKKHEDDKGCTTLIIISNYLMFVHVCMYSMGQLGSSSGVLMGTHQHNAKISI